MKKVGLLVLAAVVMALPLMAGAQDAPAGNVGSKYNVDFYGYIKLDAVYQNGYGVMDNFALYAAPGNMVGIGGAMRAPWNDNLGNTKEQHNRDMNSFSMTARQSRFGFLIHGPEDGGITTIGRLEMDFYGSAPVRVAAANQDPEENKGLMMLRRAYVEIKGDMGSILAGNEWMVVSPIFPHINNYPYGADVGNLGYRTPQIRLTGNLLDGALVLQVAACNKMGDVDTLDIDTGRMFASPTWEYGVIFKNEGMEIGYTGHYGMEEVRTTETTNTGGQLGYFGRTVPSYSHNVHVILPLGDFLAFSGEFFQGANLDGWYTGGQGNGWVMNEDGDRMAVRSSGGWGEIMIKPVDPVKLYLGYGIDDVEDDDLRDGVIEAGYTNGNGNTAITKNEMYYGNLEFSINAATKVSFEYMQILTKYDNARHQNGGKLHYEPGKIDRYTMSFWYIF